MTYVGIDGTDYASSTTAPTEAGEYQASASFAGNADHTGSSNTADFAITPATATITVTGFSGEYDGAAHGVVSSSARGVGGATIAGLSVNSTTYRDAPGGLVGWSFSNPDYVSQSGNATVTISPAILNYTIADDIQTHGTPADLASDLGTTIAGVNGETLDIAYSSIGDTTTADVGNYDITGIVSNGTGLVSNYTVNLTDGTLTVEPVSELLTPIVTVADAGGTYSSSAFQATGTVTGTSGVNLGTPTFRYYSGTYATAGDLDEVVALSGAPVNAGTYTVLASYAGDSDYTAASAVATFTISRATLDYTILNAGQTYGSPADLAEDLPATFSTGVNGQTLDIAYASSGDTATASVAAYPITGVVSNGTGLLGNYTVNLTDGTLTVNKATVSRTIGNDSQTYGNPVNLATGLGTSIPTGVNGETLDITYSSTGDTATASVGGYNITGVVSSGSGLLSNYTVSLTAGRLTVSAATPSVSVTDSGGTYTSNRLLRDRNGDRRERRQSRHADVHVL